MESEPHLAGGSTKEELLQISFGKQDRFPFPTKLIERTRDRLRLVFLEGGFGLGLLLEGDVAPRRKAGTWRSGSCRPLPGRAGTPMSSSSTFGGRGSSSARMDAPCFGPRPIFDRKQLWNLRPLEGHERWEWQSNYSSTAEHAQQVRTQFVEERKIGFMVSRTLREALARFGSRFGLHGQWGDCEEGGHHRRQWSSSMRPTAT